VTPLTQLLEAANRGEPHAAGELLPLVYDEPRKLAGAVKELNPEWSAAGFETCRLARERASSLRC
jgi:hypothetical protein